MDAGPEVVTSPHAISLYAETTVRRAGLVVQPDHELNYLSDVWGMASITHQQVMSAFTKMSTEEGT